MNKSSIYIALFLILIGFAQATLFVAQNDTILKSTDEVNFYEVFKLTNFTTYSSVIYPTSFGTPLYLNQSTFVQIAVSDDANTVYGLAYYNSSISYLIYTKDGGATWNVHGDTTGVFKPNYAVTLSGATNTGDLKMSANGQYVYLIMYAFTTISPYTAGHSYLIRSQDYGATFFATDLGVRTVGSLAVSKTGQYVDIGGGIGSIYVQHSNDYGSSYTTSTLETGLSGTIYSTVNAISPSGQYHLLLFSYATGLKRNFVGSNDYGVTWTNSTAFESTVCQTQPNMIMSDTGTFTGRMSSAVGFPCNALGTGANVSDKSNVTFYTSSMENIVGLNDLSKIYASQGNTLYRFDNNNLINPINVTTFSKGIVSVGYSPAFITPVTPICIDSNTYCTNPIYFPSGVTCSDSNIQNCGSGCSNSTGVAVCSNILKNECNVIGATQCLDSTIINKCDDWNQDGYFEYKPYLTCATGQFCLNSGNYLGSCVNTTQSGTHGLYGLSVIPYSTSTQGNVTYVNNQNTRTLEVSTTYVVHQQDFYTQGTNYISRTCDYSEPVILSTGYALVQNYGNDSVQYLPSATSSDTIIRLSFSPSNYSEGWINIADTLGSTDSKIYYQRNSSAKRMTIYDSSLNIIYADYSTNTYDDLESVDLEYSFSFVTKAYTIKMTFNRVVDNIVITNPQTFLGNNIYIVNVSQFINNSDTIINQLVISNPTPYTTFTSNLGGTTTILVINPNCNCGTITCTEYEAIYGHQAYLNLCQVNQTIPNFVQSCDYSTKGSRLVRTYGNNLGTPDYSTYVDYTIVVNGLGLTSAEVDNRNPSINAVNGTGQGLPTFWKYIIIAVTIMIIYGFGLVIGNQTQAMKTGVLVATVLSFFAIIVYTILGWISAWIIVAMIIFGVAIVIILGSTKATSGGT